MEYRKIMELGGTDKNKSLAVTIPKLIADLFGIKAGDYLSIEYNNKLNAVILKKT